VSGPHPYRSTGHRDVKPANLLVRRDGDRLQVELIDFGLALRPATLAGKVSTDGPQAHTTVGRSIAGTLHYAAPEQMGQLAGGQVGPHSDAYGFGKTNAPQHRPVGSLK
jgi:serine/threonine protein kinase